MSKTDIDDATMNQALERAWLIMAFISVALSDHPVVKSNRLYRRLTDRSRKALFDLHNEIESALTRGGNVGTRSAATQDRHRAAKPTEDDFGPKALRRKGTISPEMRLGFDDDDPPTSADRSARRKRRT